MIVLQYKHCFRINLKFYQGKKKHQTMTNHIYIRNKI